MTSFWFFFFPERVILCSDLPFTSVRVLYINLAGSKLSPYFLLLFIKQRFNSFLCPKSQVLSYISLQYLSRFILCTNPHLPLFSLLSWCLDTTHTYGKIVPLLVQVHRRPAQHDLKRLEIIPSSIYLAITFLLATTIWGKLSLSQTIMWLASVCTLGILLKKRLVYRVVIFFCFVIILATFYVHYLYMQSNSWDLWLTPESHHTRWCKI